MVLGRNGPQVCHSITVGHKPPDTEMQGQLSRCELSVITAQPLQALCTFLE